MTLMSLALCLIMDNCLPRLPDNPARITAVGDTYEQARDNAYRQAAENFVGAVVVSDREVHNQRLVKNDILVYSAAYVDKFKLIKQEERNGKVHIVIDVWLNSSKIGNRILHTISNDTEVDGARIAEQQRTYIKTKTQGDRLVAKAVEYYPSRSFDVQLKNSDFKLDHNRQLYFVGQVSVTWSDGFINSLHEVLDKTQDGDTASSASSIMIASAPNDDNFFRPNARKSFYFNDSSALSTLKTVFERKSPMLVVSFGKNIQSSCVTLPSNRFYSQARIDDFRVNTYQKDLISVAVPLYNVDIKSISEVRLSIVGKDQC